MCSAALLSLLLGAEAMVAAAVPSPVLEWKASAAAPSASDEEPEQDVLGSGPSSVFVRTTEGSGIAELQLATGRRLRSIPRGRCRESAPLGAAADARTAIFHAEGTYRHDHRYSDDRGPGCNEEVWAVDLATGRVAWKRPLPGYSSEHRILVDGGAAYVVSQAAITALRQRDGTVAWRARVGRGGAIAGDEPRIETETGVTLSRARLHYLDNPDGQWKAFGLVSLDRRTGARAWRTALDLGCAGGADFGGMAVSGEGIALAWTCRTSCHTGRQCPAEAARVVLVHSSSGKIRWSRAFPSAELSSLAADRDGLFLAEDGRVLLALDARTGETRWRAAVDGPADGGGGLVVIGTHLVTWSSDGPQGSPVLLGLDLRSGEVAWRWEAPRSAGDWATPWLGPWAIGDRLLVADHRSVYSLRVPTAGRPAGVAEPRR